MPYQIDLRRAPMRSLLALAHRGPYSGIGATFQALFAALGAPPPSGPFFALYHDNPAEVAPEALRAHAGIEGQGPCPAPLEPVTLAGGRHAVLTLKGPYTGIQPAWDWLYGTWLPASGERPTGTAPFEVYLNDPMTTAPEDLLTEIWLPLA